MKNQKEIYFFVLFTYITGGIFAQVNPRTFTEYSDYMSEKLNIKCKIPKNFIDLKYLEFWKFGQEFSAACVFNPVIQSDNQECLLMYPLIFQFQPDNIDKIAQIIGKRKPAYGLLENTKWYSPRNNIIFQLRSVLGHVDKYGDIIRDSIFCIDDYVRVISGKKVRKSFNADSVFVYDIPIKKAYKEKYVYYAGMVIAKKDRPYIQLMWLFTKEGEGKKDKYFKMLNKKLWYRD